MVCTSGTCLVWANTKHLCQNILNEESTVEIHFCTLGFAIVQKCTQCRSHWNIIQDSLPFTLEFFPCLSIVINIKWFIGNLLLWLINVENYCTKEKIQLLTPLPVSLWWNMQFLQTNKLWSRLCFEVEKSLVCNWLDWAATRRIFQNTGSLNRLIRIMLQMRID